MREPWRHAVGVACVAVALIGCGKQANDPGERVPVARPDPEVPVTTDRVLVTPPSQIDEKWDDVTGVPRGHRIPVASSDGMNLVGYVNANVIRPIHSDAPNVSPIYKDGGPSSDSGTVIAYWAKNVGWISSETYHSADFNYETLLAQHRAGAPPR